MFSNSAEWKRLEDIAVWLIHAVEEAKDVRERARKEGREKGMDHDNAHFGIVFAILVEKNQSRPNTYFIPMRSP